jgi:hypothetical protein
MLILNYVGHGGYTGWAQELLLQASDIANWDNKDRMPFMVTATCDFGVYDDPGIISAAIKAMNSTTGGVIGLMTTTRPVYQTSNFTINSALYDFMFFKQNGQFQPIGEVMRQTKNHSISGVNNRNYSLLADPSMVLAYPEENIAITSINGHDIATYTDTLKALSKVTMEGEVRVGSAIQTGFTGVLDLKVFDKASSITTLGNQSNPTTFQMFSNFLYNGKASVKDGEFSVTFVVPKDISYKYGKGRLSLYAAKSLSLTDANGYENKFVVGGSAEGTNTDNVPPRLKAFMDDPSFVSGGLTGADPVLLIDLFDENGINIAGSGIGHDIVATIDDQKEPIVLNEFYTGKLDNYQEGTVQYNLQDLAPGPHVIKIKAWDTYNNSGETSIEFIVYNDEQLSLRNILNYPNPFSTHTNFHFDHNRAGDDIQVLVQIFTVSGKLIKTINEQIFQAPAHISEISWNGKDDFGDSIGKGVYVYKVEVRSLRDHSKNHKYQKLVILN